MSEKVVIPRRFKAAGESGQGGYCSGLLGKRIEGPAEVRLYRPIPLETPLEIDQVDDTTRLLHGDDVLAEGRPADLDVELPTPVSPDVAAKAWVSPEEFDIPDELIDAGFLRAFGLDPERPDGLRLWPGYIEGREDEVAAPLVFPDSLADERGRVPEEVVWATLDVPAGWAFNGGDLTRALERFGGFGVTGTFTATVSDTLHAEEQYVAQGWLMGVDGRKFFSGAAIFTADSEPLAWCRETWIVPRAQEPMNQ